jgi:hypothetical protein
VRYMGANEGSAVVRLTADECELIADGVRDDSDPDDPSISRSLATAFDAFAVVARLSAESAE